jgi:tetrapyrrole methylase family protein/MazG family protein
VGGPARVVVVGLGPAGDDLLVPAAREALVAARRRFARTTRHPCVDDLAAAGVTFESFDDRYDAGTDLESVYAGIVGTLLEVAEQDGTVAYAVPGSPAVAERTVALLRVAARAEPERFEVQVVPGLSFAELAWSRLGVDPMAGARVVDGRDFSPDALTGDGPLLVAQCDSPFVLSDVKLQLLERLAPDTPVVVLQRLGLAGERVTTVALEALDRDVVPDHLTAIFVDAPVVSAARELNRLLELARQLRAPGGCPWDAEQTHHSLARYLLEESYEVVEVLELLPVDAPAGAAGDPAYVALVDELGDLLYQVVFHVVLAEEAGAFTMADVARGIHDKLVRRHPHVFGDVSADTGADVVRNWEQIKRAEKGHDSIVAGITPGLPSLLYAHKLYSKAASVGLDAGDAAASLARVRAAADTLSNTDAADGSELALGELLAASVALARAGGLDAESALRGWAVRFRERFERFEAAARDRGADLGTLDAATAAALWRATDPAPVTSGDPTDVG